MLTVAYVGSQGRNLFLRSWTNGIVGVTTNPTTGAGAPILQFGARFAQIDLQDQRRHGPLRLAADHIEPPVQQGPDGGIAMDLRPQYRRHRRIQ